MSAIPLADRVNWIGSSEAAILLGVSPYGTAFGLFHEKAGNVPHENLDHLERIQAGRYLEPAIAMWGGEKWGDWTPRNVPHHLEHPSVPKLGASLDFDDRDFADNGDFETCPPIEIKNVDGLIFRDNWTVEGEKVVDAPLHFLVQVQHQLACRPRAPHGWLLACVGGNKLYRMRVERHEKIIARIEREVAKFWQSIEANEPPDPDFTQDGPTIAQLYGKGSGEILDLRGDSYMAALCATYLGHKDLERADKKEADEALAEIKSIVGDASGVITDAYKVSVVDIAEGEVKAFTRKPYRRWTIKQIADKEAA